MGSVGTFLQQNSGALAGLEGTAQSAMQLVGGIMEQRQAKKNAKLARRQGRQAEAQGAREAALAKGAARARFAKGGVRPDEGSALDVQLDVEEQVMLGARRRKRAFGAEADIQSDAGFAAMMQGLFGAGTTLLGTVRNIAGTQKPPGLTGRSTTLPATGGPYGGFGNIA